MGTDLPAAVLTTSDAVPTERSTGNCTRIEVNVASITNASLPPTVTVGDNRTCPEILARAPGESPAAALPALTTLLTMGSPLGAISTTLFFGVDFPPIETITSSGVPGARSEGTVKLTW